jgi:hypothetical protein
VAIRQSVKQSTPALVQHTEAGQMHYPALLNQILTAVVQLENVVTSTPVHLARFQIGQMSFPAPPLQMRVALLENAVLLQAASVNHILLGLT